MKEFETGQRVTITNELEGSRTQQLYKLDSRGFMLQMQGKHYFIANVIFGTNRIRIKNEEAGRTYIFNESDIYPYEEELPPNEFIFNENLLDI